MQTDILKKMLKDSRFSSMSKNRRNVIELLNTRSSTSFLDKLKNTFSFDLKLNENSPIYFYEQFIQCLFFEEGQLSPQCQEYLDVVTKHTRLCLNCGLVDIQSQNYLTITVSEFGVDSLAEELSVLKGGHVLKKCRCAVLPKVFVMSLPVAMIVKVKNCCNLGK